MELPAYYLHRIFLLNVSCYLVYREGEAILVDCGNRGSEVRILDTMKKLGLEPEHLRLLILTHVHFDHAGSAAALHRLTGCRVVVHRNDAERLRRGLTPIPGGTRWKAKVLVAAGRIFRRRIMRFPPAEPGLVVEEELDLETFGFPGKVLHTPGHTPGSMVVWMERGELLAGDTLFGVEGKLHFPPFAEDVPALLESWDQLRSLPLETIYPAHGKPFGFRSFLEEYDAAVSRYTG
jgi:hydroxyacylglutathione hydrolase